MRGERLLLIVGWLTFYLSTIPIEEKNVCALMSSMPFGPDPSRLVGFLLKRARRRDWASGLGKVGI